MGNCQGPRIGVGIVGTGYAAKLRAQAVTQGEDWSLVGVAGKDPQRTAAFAQGWGVPSLTVEALLDRPDVEVVIIATVNRDHGSIARSALERGLHTVVEYPLALDLQEARQLLALAQARGVLLHVEHIELLGGLHQSLKAHLPAIGVPHWVRYATLKADRPAPRRWIYQHSGFGFPLAGALSRLHRLTDAFGTVAAVTCQAQFWPLASSEAPQGEDFFSTCVCSAQLQFTSGLMAMVTYGKGEALWRDDRTLEVHGSLGALCFDQDQGVLISAQGSEPLAVGGRRGLFAQDTQGVADYLRRGVPLYVQPQASLYALEVAMAAQEAARSGATVQLDPAKITSP